MTTAVIGEARALADAAGIVRRDDIATLRVSGADRVDYLHRMLTQDLTTIEPGQARPACLLNPQGRILGTLLVWNIGDALLLELPRASVGVVGPVLEKYVIQDDVNVGEAIQRATRFDLIGAGAPGALASLGLPAPDPGTFLDVTVGDVEIRLLRHDLGSRVRFVARVPEGGEDAFLGAVEGCGCVRVCTFAAFEIARLEEGVPVFGRELTDDVLLNEAGLDDHVSFTKGCYPGQEPVVMAKHRGRPPRRLCSLTVEDTEVPHPGAEILQKGRPVGVVTSAGEGVVRPGIRALAYVKTAFAEEGATLSIGDRGTVWIERVRQL